MKYRFNSFLEIPAAILKNTTELFGLQEAVKSLAQLC